MRKSKVRRNWRRTEVGGQGSREQEEVKKNGRRNEGGRE